MPGIHVQGIHPCFPRPIASPVCCCHKVLENDDVFYFIRRLWMADLIHLIKNTGYSLNSSNGLWIAVELGRDFVENSLVAYDAIALRASSLWQVFSRRIPCKYPRVPTASSDLDESRIDDVLDDSSNGVCSMENDSEQHELERGSGFDELDGDEHSQGTLKTASAGAIDTSQGLLSNIPRAMV